MSATPVKLRDPSRRLAIETLSIRAKLSGPVWRLLSRSEWPVCAPEESPGGIAVVEVEEGDDCAYVLTGRRGPAPGRCLSLTKGHNTMNDLPPSMFTQITPETPAGARRLETIRELFRAGTVPEWWARLAAPHVDTVYPPRDVRERFAGAWARVWPRPRRADHPTVTDAAFEAIVSGWDAERARADHFDRLRAEREAAAQAESEAHKAADDAQREQDAAVLKAQLRAQFLRLPGTTEQEFEERYPEILRDHRRRLMAGQTTDATRAAVRHTLRGAYS